MKPRPGDVVRCKVVMVDFGKIRLEPGTHGLICPEAVDGMSNPLVHWANGYTCNAAFYDFTVLPEAKVGRIEGAVSSVCRYCNGGAK